ncbi:site-2 protease family protein [Euryarchaeota archaeon]|nr:site-2 protease family protein [Euryarchaeota archaeon]
MSKTITNFLERFGWNIDNYIWDGSAHLFYVQEPDDLEIKFEELRLAFKKVNSLGADRAFPMLRRAGDELILVVIPQPSFDYVKNKMNLYLLIATIFTTTWAGSMWWASYSDSELLGMSWFWLRLLITPDVFFMGFLTFSLPLMAILGTHEMGHYYYAKKHNLDASLPFFLPMPPMIFPFGTMGAFISIREPIPNRKALLDVGASGPIAGLLVAIPITILGFWLTEQNAVPTPIDSGDSLYLGTSIFFDLLYGLTGTFYTPSGDYLSHPVVLAGWTGFFVTALNLMPAGQLDGGHIARALLGPKANGLSFGVIILLLFMAFYGIPSYEPYSGWAVYALLIYFLGTSHPPPSEELSKLGKSRWGVGILTALILVTTFTPSPIYTVESEFDLSIESEITEFNPVFGESNITNFTIKNIGESGGWDNLTIDIDQIINYTIIFEVKSVFISDSNSLLNSSSSNFSNYVWWDLTGHNLTLNLTSNSYANLTLLVTPLQEPIEGIFNFDLRAISRTEHVYTRTFDLVVEEKA